MMREIDLSHLDLNLLVTFEVLMHEGNVTRAAERLGRTQSAVSHSLGRLRQQLGDPLLVKAGGRMSPTPFALKLVEDIRPILRSIQRVVAPPQPFEPRTSKRIFRIAFPAASSDFMANVIARVQSEAPGVGVDWITADAEAFAGVAAGLIDIAEIGGDAALPDGVQSLEGRPFRWLTFARKDHPARKNWGIEAWRKWPHIKLKVTDRVHNPVEEASQKTAGDRTIGAWVPHASSVAPLLLRTDLLATFPPILISEGLTTLGLCALEPPIPIPDMRMRFFWSFRLVNDPGSKWFRELVIDVFRRLGDAAERSLREVGVIRVRRGKGSR
jgi:DNA-binding transcriptional LysR family regulator